MGKATARGSVAPCSSTVVSASTRAASSTSARAAEKAGYDGIWSAETSHDPFLPLALAAEHTDHLELGTGIAVAFARNPMNLAVVANDLQTLSRGRFMLGLGSQIRPHIEKRYSMPWSHPAARMREMVLAIRAIWPSWSEGEPARLPWRVLPAHPDDPDVRPGPQSLRQPEDLRGRRRPADDRGGRGGGRRPPRPRLHHRALHPGGDHPRPRARPRHLGSDPGRLPDLLPGHGGDRPRRGRPRDGQDGGEEAARLLRLDAGLPPGPRAARLGRPADRAQHPLQTGEVGRDGRPHRRRDGRDLRRGRVAR